MGDAIRAKDVPGRNRGRAARERARTVKQQQLALKDKAFADLTAEEKDDILKALAIMTGIVKE